MKVAEVAERWGISLRSAYRLINEGDLPVTKVLMMRPTTRLDVDGVLVDEVARMLPSDEKVTVSRIKYILGGIEENVKK